MRFDAPEVVHAAEVLGELWFTEGNVYGGNVAINATSTADAPVPMFTEGGPDCWLHKQAGWIPGFFPGNVDVDPADWAVVPGEGASFFYFPEIDPAYGRPALGSGDQFVMFNDRPEVRAVMEYLATADAAKGWIADGGFVSPNSAVDPSLYTNYTSAEIARILSEATAVRFDASDLMPAQVGAGTFWSGMVEWISANGEGTEGILADIEASWPD